MQTAPFPDAPISANEHVLRVLQLNKDHQTAVKTQIEQLENKLAALDKLLVRAVPQIPWFRVLLGARLLQKSTTKMTSSPRWAGMSPSPGPQ